MSQQNNEIMQVEFHCTSFTTVTNHCLEDTTLPCDARGLLITMISLSHDWHYSVAGLLRLVPDGDSKVRRMLHNLEEHGYLFREKYRNSRGQFCWKYHIYDESQTYHDKNSGKNPDNQERNRWSGNAERHDLSEKQADEGNHRGFTTAEKPHKENPGVEEPSVENPAQLNTNELNTDIALLKSINHSEIQTENLVITIPEPVDVIDMLDHKNVIREQLGERLKYDKLIRDFPKQKKLVDTIFRVMTDILLHDELPEIKISGCIYSHAELEEAFNSIEYEHVVYIVNCISNSAKAIKSPQKYILQCLIQAHTMDLYEISRVNHRNKNNFCNFEQRTYDFAALEKRLLDN